MPDDFSHQAGQYLCVVHPDGTAIPLSIASAPDQLPTLHLHYKSSPGDPSALAMDQLLELWADGHLPNLTVSAAMGDCLCPLDPSPLLVIAAGTGAAQGFACAQARASHAECLTQILWCAESQEDLYQTDVLSALAGVSLVTKVDATRDHNNAGMRWLQAHALDRYANILIAGGPPFVYAITDLLIAWGVEPGRMMADAYSYAPRT